MMSFQKIISMKTDEKVLKNKGFYNSISKGLVLYSFYNDIRIV